MEVKNPVGTKRTLICLLHTLATAATTPLEGGVRSLVGSALLLVSAWNLLQF